MGKKKGLQPRLAVIAVLTLIFFFFAGFGHLYAAARWRDWLAAAGLGGKVVVVDPGHGGADPGTLAGGVEEKDINQAVARRLVTNLRESGCRAIVTLEADPALKPVRVMRAEENRENLYRRRRLAERRGALLLVSLHVNSSSDPGVRGPIVYYWPGNPASERLGRCIREALHRRTAFPCPLRPANFVVIKSPQVPAVLVEMGFITNYWDRVLLCSDVYQEGLAQALLEGIKDFSSSQEE